MMATAASKKSFATSFWGDNDKGLEVMMARMRAAKHVSEEILALLKERASIEEDYGKRLTKLAKAFSPREEIGTLRESLDVVRTELENSARAHLDVANEIKVQLEKPTAEFLANQSSIRKNHNAIMEKHLKAKSNMTSTVVKAKERYESKCIEYNQLMSSKPGLPPKELEKVKAKIEKVSNQMKTNDLDYLNGVEKLADIHRKWEEDMRTACRECQKLEEDRIDHIRSTVWNYANMLSSLCVSDDESCERIRGSLERCDIERDISLFLDNNATGSEVPAPLSYVNFYTRTSERPLAAAARSNSNLDVVTNGSGRAGSQGFDAPQAINEYKADGGGNWSANVLNSAAIKSVTEPFGGGRANNGRVESTTSLGLGSFGATAKSEVDSALPSDTQFQYDPYEGVDNISIMFEVRVLYDYAAQAYEELTIMRNQVVPVFATHDDGWWEGVCPENGKLRKGLFPSNFVQRI